MSDGPRRRVVHGVMAAAEHFEVVRTCSSTVFERDRVVDVGAVRGSAASRPAAVLVAGGDEATQARAGPVGVDVERLCGDRVGHDAVPTGGRSGESAGGVGVDGGDPIEEGGFIALAGEGEDRDGDVHGRPDRTESGAAGRGGGRGEEEIAHDVRAALVEASLVRFGCLVSVLGRIFRVALCVGRSGLGGTGRGSKIGVDLTLGDAHHGEAFIDAVDQSSGGVEEKSAEAVVEVVGAYASLLEGATVVRGDDVGLET